MNYLYRLPEILSREPVEWDAFQRELDELAETGDINRVDEEWGETLLFEALIDAELMGRGEVLLEAVRRILAAGFDVKAHEGFCGDYALGGLCWTTYDRSVLDAAKLLLDSAGEERIDVSAAIGSAEWRIAGAWNVYDDWEFGNVLEAYIRLLNNYQQGKEYRSVNSFHRCIGLCLDGVAAVGSIEPLGKGLHSFSESIVFFFGDVPLEVTDFIVTLSDPVFAEDNKEKLRDESGLFSDYIGAKLADMYYLDMNQLVLEFDNGRKLLFTRAVENKKYKGSYVELSDGSREPSLEELQILEIYRDFGKSYADHKVVYEEDALVLHCADGTYILYPDYRGGTSGIRLQRCSEGFVGKYARVLRVSGLQVEKVYRRDGSAEALRVKCDEGWVYVRLSQFRGLDIMVSDMAFDPMTEIDLDRFSDWALPMKPLWKWREKA